MEAPSARSHPPCDLGARRHQGGSESVPACATMWSSIPLNALRLSGETKLTMRVSAPAFELHAKTRLGVPHGGISPQLRFSPGWSGGAKAPVSLIGPVIVTEEGLSRPE